jgi:hypothetical protein
MNRLFLSLSLLAALVAPASAQNWATVTASNITDLNQQKLAAGQLCFLGTDQSDTPISFSAGGGGQVLKRSFCANVTNGAVSALTIPNPALTAPSGVYYRVTVIDSSSGREVLRYTQVTFSGGAFNFDTYAPTNLGQMSPLSGTSVTGTLSVAGNVNATGSVAAGSVVINGDTAMSKAPRMTTGQFATNLNAIGSFAPLFVTEHSVTITRLQSLANVPPAGCTTFPTVSVFNNTTSSILTSLTLTSSTLTDSGPISINVAAGQQLVLRTTATASGCTINAANIGFAVQWKMQ